MDAFTWSSVNMPRIDPDFLCHRLTMDEKVKPIVKRRRKFNEERRLIIREETQKLLNVDHIREIQYPEWLVNVVLVQKANGKWRICIEFTDLNKACQGFLPASMYRFLGGQCLGLSTVKPPGRVLEVQPNLYAPQRREQDCLHGRVR